MKWPKTFIVVSHAREFLNTVFDNHHPLKNQSEDSEFHFGEERKDQNNNL